MASGFVQTSVIVMFERFQGAVKVLTRGAPLALGLGAVWLLSKLLWERLVFEFSSPSGWDSPVYWAVGRGITNGLAPWKDLFDNKPPGIHLVTALSYILTDGTDFAQALQAVAILIIALIPLASALFDWRSLQRVTMTRLLVSLLGGLLLALYASARCDELQTEFFGAAAGSMYLLALYYPGSTSRVLRFFVLSFFLAISTGFKEPFALVLMAGALIKNRSLREFVDDFLLPACGAFLFGISCLLFLGWFEAYVFIYLNVIFNHRLFLQDLPTPLWKRGLEVAMVMRDVASFSPSLLISLVVSGISIPLLALVSTTRFARVAGGFTGEFSWRGLISAGKTVGFVLIGAYLAVLAVELGGYRFDHYFIFAIPFYQSLIIRFSRDVLVSRGKVSAIVSTAALASMLYGSFVLTGPDYRTRATTMQAWRKPGSNTAALLDEVLNDCGIERYLSIGYVGALPYGFTRHSPLGPLFVQWRPWLNYELFRTTLWHNVTTAQVIAVNTADWTVLGDLEEAVRLELARNFQEQAWSCYKGQLQPLAPFKVFYRKR